MLHQGNKLFIVLLGILLFFSCNKYKKYDEKEIADIRKRVLSTSQSILGKKTYFSVYQMANDSIANWSKYGLGKYIYFGNTTDYQLDSVFCVNKAGDKIFFSMLRRNLNTESKGDGISYFYGVKIESTWYFFKGEYMVLPREFYQKDLHTPLSFEKMQQIATSNIYRNYLKKNKEGQWEINDRFLERISDKNQNASGYGSCFECQTEEDYYLYLVERNWRQKKKREEEKIRLY